MSDFLRRGSTGPTTRTLQCTLNQMTPALPPLVPDGSFGQQTEGRVKHCQRLVGDGLVDDGVVGFKTLGAFLRPQQLTFNLSVLRRPGAAPAATAPPPRFPSLFLPPTPLATPKPGGGPNFTPLYYDPRDAVWHQQMRAWMDWVQRPFPGGPMPTLPTPLPPSLLPPALPMPPSPLPPNLPTLFPVQQFSRRANTGPLALELPPLGGTTEIKLEANGTFSPFDKKKPFKTEYAISAMLWQISFLGGKGEISAGPQLLPFDDHPFQGSVEMEIKPLKYDPFKGQPFGVVASAAFVSALTFPPVEASAMLKGQGALVWRPRKTGFEASLGLALGGKIAVMGDDSGAAAIKLVPLFIKPSLQVTWSF